MSEWEILQGSVFARLAELDDGIAQCCITSPPYFGLRDYGTAEWEGGDPACSHRVGGAVEDQKAPRRHRITGVRPMKDSSTCGLCGAIRIDEQIGLERTPDLYAEKMVAVFQQVRRVLRDDGVVWLNLGDSYNAYNGNSGPGSGIDGPGRARNTQRPALATGHGLRVGSLKPKDLLGIPWLVAFALREDGWYLRKDIIWHKPNPMPESVIDRPTSAHEHVFLLAKSDRYYYDAEAISEEATYGEPNSPQSIKSPYGQGFTERAERGESAPASRRRNKRDVWTVATRPYPDAHFATFPEELIVPMVLAGSAPQACSSCGAPWTRVVERKDEGWNGSRYGKRKVESNGGVQTGGTERSTLGSSNGTGTAQAETTGWKPTCSHADGGGRSLVIDPFAGSGTTLGVAVAHGRDALGVELNPEYVELVRRRMSGVTAPLFAGL